MKSDAQLTPPRLWRLFACLAAAALIAAPLHAVNPNPNQPPDPTYTVTIDSLADGETFEKGSGETASGTGTETDENGDTDVSDDITWSGDASGSGATSDDFTGAAGEITLTADLEDESDSITAYIVEKESITLKDTSTDAGTRETTSTLVMVYSDNDRTADIEFAYTSSSASGDGYPTWSGTGITANDGDLTGAFSGGTGDYDVTITYANGATENVTVEVVDEEKIEETWDLDSEKIEILQNKINSAISTISGGGGPQLNLSGTLDVELKFVDMHGVATQSGGYASITGTVTAEFPNVEFSSPEIVLGSTGCKMKISAKISDSSMSLSANTNYDESKSSPGSVSGSITGTTTVSATATVGTLGDVVKVSLTGSTNLSANGEIALESRSVELSGELSSSNLEADFSVDCDLGWVGEYELYSGDYTFDGTGVSKPFSKTLHDFS